MPKVTHLSLISTSTTATSFLVTDNTYARRINYENLKQTLVSDILASGTLIGPTGPQGISGYSGYSGYGGTGGSGEGTSGYSGYSGTSGYSGYSGTSGYSGFSGIGIPAGGLLGQSLVKLSNNDYDTTWSTISGGSGVGLMSRTVVNGTTTNISNNASENLTLTGFKGYVLYKIQTSHAAFVTIYSDIASRTSDAGRSELTDPSPGAGIIAEVITTGNQTVTITPAAIGFNNESTPTTDVYIRVKNLNGSSAAITVTLTILGVEQ